jgi:two-component system LytT family response regulator
MGEEYKVLIVDDEVLARDIIKNYLKSHKNLELIGECSNGFEGIKSISENEPDIVFLDIQMPKLNGFEMLELLETYPQIIFTTAFDQYALRAFEINAVDYLLKPFTKDRFDEAVDRAIERLETSEKKGQNLKSIIDHYDQQEEKLSRIIVKNKDQIIFIPIEELRYIEANVDYVNIYSGAGKFMKSRTMKYFESRLDDKEFIRIHRSYIVRIKEIESIVRIEKESFHAVLKDGTKLPISRSGYSKLSEKFN